MTDDEPSLVDGDGHPIVDTPPEVKAAVIATARARHVESLLAVAVAAVVLGVVGATAWNTYRLRTLTHQNVQAQNFGLQAVSCILDNLADHRWSNQVFHDNLAEFLHAPTTPHVPLVLVPSDAQFEKDCGPFNLRTEQREGTGGPIVTTTTGAKP